MLNKTLWINLSVAFIVAILWIGLAASAEVGTAQPMDELIIPATNTYTVTLPIIMNDYPTLTIWHSLDEVDRSVYQDVIDEYNLSHPDISIRLIYKQNMDEALSKAILEGSGPEIVEYSDDIIGAWAGAGYITSIDTWINQLYLEENFEPAAVNGVIHEDQIWAIPDTQEGIALVYNRDIISEPEIPASFDFSGLLMEAKEFHSQNPDIYYLCNQGLGSKDAYHAAPIYFGFGLNAYGGYVDENGIAYMNTPAALSAAQWIDDLALVSPQVTSHWICRNMLVNGQAAIWWTGPWALSDLKDQGVNYGIISMGNPFVTITGFMLTPDAVDRGKAEVAIELMKYLGSMEVQKQVTLVNHTIPSNTAALGDSAVQAIYEIAQFGEALNLGIPMANHIYSSCQWEPVGNATLAIWNGTLTPTEAMQEAQAEIEACIADMSP